MSNCHGTVTESGGRGFNFHQCTREGTIVVSFVGGASYIPFIFHNKIREAEVHEVKQRTEYFCKTHFREFRRNHKEYKVLSGDVPPAELPKRAFTFEFTARTTTYARTEEEARRMVRYGYPMGKLTLLEVR